MVSRRFNSRLKQFNIFRVDVGFVDLQVQIRCLVADGGCAPQPDHAHFALELGLQPDHGHAGVGGGVVKAVLVVHIKHQHGG